MMVNDAVYSALGIWALSCIPIVTATLGDVCTTNADGLKTCHSRLTRSAKIGIAISCVFVLLLLFSLVMCVMHNRRAAASQQEYNVEASQVEGPPTIIATEYDPTSGPSGVYGAPKSGFRSGQSSAQMTGPTYPLAAQVYSNQQNRTAPVTQPTFPDQSYPFTGYSPRVGPTPQTAYVTGGFPRTLLTGARLKDKLKERPASISHTLG